MPDNAFVGEVRAFGFGFAPKDWLACNGQLLPISQNAALFSILGTNFGGDGKVTFGLPNLQGSVAIGAGAAPGMTAYNVGATGGQTQVQLTLATLASHTHPLQVASGRFTANATTPGPTTALAPAAVVTPYLAANPAPPTTQMAPSAIGSFGVPGSPPHNNMMPYMAANFCICTNGVFPTRP